MRIKEITRRSRRDFWAIYVCDNCGFEQKGDGYDDRNFHENVIPNMICPECGEISGKVTSHNVIPEGPVL